MSDDRNDEKDKQQPVTYRHFVDAYYRPCDHYREGTNPHGEVIDVDHADGPMRTRATLEPEGADFEMSGRPPRKEEGTREVCIRLAAAISQLTGQAWIADDHEPSGPEMGIDWFIKNPRGERLPVQVTRVGSRERWAEVGSLGRAMGTASVSEAASDLWNAIERKLTVQDPRTVLALSVGQPGYYSFDRIVAEFHRRYDTQRQRVQYREVWLVGYSPATTLRLFPLF